MNGAELQRRAADRALELPGSVLTHPFGEEWDVYKVHGKVFMLQSAESGEAHVTLKARPEDSHALREAYDDIRPGYHMNKKHWISLYPGGRLDGEFVDDLVTESYLLVVAGLPKRDRPVNPETFGQS
ncbi:MmcQ/YjbR family DNA-binding protein [Demequina sp. NBRC 110057]|uniref:MmcQ/YjbR family DNA-binding protein n=1 Tax=Demequina sp. NBRC 110057 TaxID=1570346 RepID=UPI0009FE3E13|nr:MmcQ/YjbR family DNA-binding protein [Demequina sp. NBRC 110057]